MFLSFVHKYVTGDLSKVLPLQDCHAIGWSPKTLIVLCLESIGKFSKKSRFHKPKPTPSENDSSLQKKEKKVKIGQRLEIWILHNFHKTLYVDFQNSICGRVGGHTNQEKLGKSPVALV